ADDLANPDRLANLHIDLRQVSITGREAIAVIDLHHLAVPAAPARALDLAVSGGAYWIAGAAADIEAGVHRRAAEERVGAHAETRRQIDLAQDWLSHRHSAKCQGQPLGVQPGQMDAVKLALERTGIL